VKKPLIAVSIFFTFFLIFFWIYFPSWSRYRELKIEEEHLKTRLDEVNLKIESLTEEKDLLKNDLEYLERVIRDELGLVKPGELVYQFVSKDEVQDKKILTTEDAQESS